ncbi:HAD family hydrolase [Saccharopolyspora taberi]|uniref:HAD family hydrolase n=1 Tax=Saccharopolyspora taberi TaxID=60895 RepID=A0ABN3V7F0_9PSEU
MTEVRGVVFDLDGTLVNSVEVIVSITTSILADRRIEVGAEEIRAAVGKPLDRTFARFFDVPRDHPEVPTAIETFKSAFASRLAEGEVRLYPGVAEGLAVLRKSGLRLGVATSKLQEGALRTVRATGTAGSFDAVVGHDLVARGKPAPDGALRAARELALRPGDCVVVGDTAADIGMAKAAGMMSVGVTYGVASAAQLADADVLADSFPSVVSAILGR